MDRKDEILELKDQVLSLVRHTIESYALHGAAPDVSSSIPDALKKRAGAFVSIKKEGELRGCIGTVRPTCSTLYEELISSALGAASRDPRFSPIEAFELPKLSYSVDILGELKEVKREGLDPKTYGVLVEKGLKRGLLLPDLKDITTVDQQIQIACDKAGISSLEGVKFYRFTVERFKE